MRYIEDDCGVTVDDATGVDKPARLTLVVNGLLVTPYGQAFATRAQANALLRGLLKWKRDGDGWIGSSNASELLDKLDDMIVEWQ